MSPCNKYGLLILGTDGFDGEEFVPVVRDNQATLITRREAMDLALSKIISGIVEKYNHIEILTAKQRGFSREIISWSESMDFDLFIYEVDWEEFGKAALHKRDDKILHDLYALDNRAAIVYLDKSDKYRKALIRKMMARDIPVRVFDSETMKYIDNASLAKILQI